MDEAIKNILLGIEYQLMGADALLTQAGTGIRRAKRFGAPCGALKQKAAQAEKALLDLRGELRGVYRQVCTATEKRAR